MPHTAHRTPCTAHRTQPNTAIIWHEFKLLYVNVICIYMNMCKFMWIYVNDNMIVFYFISKYLNYSESTRVYMNMFWIYLKICTLPDYHTLLHHWRSAHYRAQCRAHSRTAAHCRIHCCTTRHSCALCRTLPHAAWIRMPDSRTLRIVHRTQSHTAINMIYNIFIWMWMHAHECAWIMWFWWSYVNQTNLI
jgi:hypothetical protein